NQPRQIPLLLLLVAVAADLVDAEIGMRAIGEPDRRRGAAHLPHRDHMVEIAQAGAAKFLLDRDAENSDVAHLPPEIGGELVLAVDVGGARRDLPGCEARPRVADHLRVIAEIEIERWETHVGNAHGSCFLVFVAAWPRCAASTAASAELFIGPAASRAR